MPCDNLTAMPHTPAKYPVGIQTFPEIIEEGYLYVDKTEYVRLLIDNYKCVFLSRPRRFGKSLLMSTLEAFFQGKKNLFKGLAIDNYESAWVEYPVFRFDLSSDNFTNPSNLVDCISRQLKRFERSYRLDPSGSIAGRFWNLITAAYDDNGKKAVILIDEYDKPILDTLDHTDRNRQLKDELRGFYSVIKSCDQYIRFAMLTGISQFSRMSVFSGLNNLEDISLLPQFNSICGISEQEMHRYFAESVVTFAEKTGKSDDCVWNELKKQYDGYHFSEDAEDIYNPLSVLSSFKNSRMENYWYATGTSKFLLTLIRENSFNIGEFEGTRRSSRHLADISGIDSDIVPLLYQAGYLTIKSYDKDSQLYTLGFPNEEVTRSFWDSLANNFFPRHQKDGRFDISLFIKAVNAGNPTDFMERLKSLFADTSSEYEPDKEIHFQNMTAIVFKMLSFVTHTEVHSARGRCDLEILSDRYIYIFEFKVDGTAIEAMDQIFEQGYAKRFYADPRTKFLIGANFSTTLRNITEYLVEELPKDRIYR